ncbi:MAG: sugar phosphate isomerase/epimerase [Thermoplasmatales archaeon]|mgnify:CR=1 FL=1|nr:sugar phosphate isomerase/epimerase [Thermoplasmatales archaeon]
MIGVSSTAFCRRPFAEVMEEISKAFTHWEVFSEGEHSLGLIYEYLKDSMRSYDMTYSIHSPISDINIASLNERIREASVMELILTMDIAQYLGVRTVTIHPGITPLAMIGPNEKAVAAARKSLRTLDRVGADYGIDVALENMPNFPFMLGKTVEELSELLDGTDLGVCFDIGHANTVGDPAEMVKPFLDRLVNVHIHDNRGETDEHLTIGDGNVDFKKVVGVLSGYRGKWVIESKSMESALESKPRLESFF